MKKLLIALLIAAPIGAIAQESFIQLPVDSTGKKLRMRTSTQNATTVYSQGFFLDDGSGSGPLGISSNPIFVNFVAGATTAITASSLPLPTGAATDATVAETHAAAAAVLPSKDSVVGGSDYGGTPRVQTIKVDSSGNIYAILGTSSAVIGHIVVDSVTGTVTIAGTVTANVGTTNGLALDATLTGGTEKAIARGGAKGATAAADVTSTANGVDHQGLDVQLQNPSVTVNAGTNLNTSALALETGGNLATVNTNTAPLVTSGAGGYMRQDSTATIARESGGNLATIATNTTGVATAANQTNGNAKTQLVGSTTANVTVVVSSQIDTTLLAASATRKAWNVCNSSQDLMLLKLGGGASQWSYTVKVPPQGCYGQTDIAYNGQVDAVWYPGGTGQAVVTELQP